MWDHAFSVFVPGLPAPQGSKTGFVNPKLIRFLGPFKVDPKSLRVVMVEHSKRVKPWREAIVATCREQRVERGIDTPVFVHVEFRFVKPKTVKRIYPTGNEGDIDKLLRSTYDGLVMAGVLTDDSLIVDGGQRMRYAEPWEEPGANIRIEVLPY